MKKTILLATAFVMMFSFFETPTYAAIGAPAVEGKKAIPGDPDAATVKNALAEFKNLSRKEKKERLKEVKKTLKEYKKAKRAGDPQASSLVQIICAILIPPLGVYLHEGEINKKFWIDLILTLIFFIPGMIYALIVVLGED